MTDQSAERLAEAMNRLSAVLEQHLTPRPIKRQRRHHERRELTAWLSEDTWPDDRDGGGC